MRAKYSTTLSLRKTKNYLHLIDMAKNKTVLQTLGFAYGESEIAFASQCVFTTLPFGGGGCGVWSWGYGISRQTDRLKSLRSSHKVSLGQLSIATLYDRSG